MGSDSIMSASIPNASKDFGKKKRAHRSARLKQCKLDVRREQWLSQVRNKVCKDEVSGLGVRDISNPAIVVENKPNPRLKDLETRRQREDDNYGSIHPDSDSESPANSPSSSVSGGNEVGNNYNGCSSSSISSSFSSGGCCSGSITEEEEATDGDGECLDDWEAVADALAAASIQDKPTNNQKTCPAGKEFPVHAGSRKEVINNSKGILGPGGVKLRSDIGAVETMPVANNQAWRADDASRPQTLPNLLKQNSFPLNPEKNIGHCINPWGRKPAVPVITCCPICCEDLDFTDSSFFPCPCGFSLCLFCHKRIMEEDGRCPGCRKQYQPQTVEKGTSVSGGNLTIRLARSCSMFSRT